MSYTIPNASIPQHNDSTYDGKKQNNLLIDGLGCLIDGEVGADDYRLNIGDGKGEWTQQFLMEKKLSYC